MTDETLIRIIHADIPDWIPLFVEKTVLNTFPEMIVVDHASTEKLEFSFIPPLPKNLSEYNFYSPSEKI